MTATKLQMVSEFFSIALYPVAIALVTQIYRAQDEGEEQGLPIEVE